MSSISDQNIPGSAKLAKVGRSQLIMWGGASLFMLVLIGLIVGSPYAMSHGYDSLGAAIFRGFSPLCHQISERSFHLDGHAFAVCSRCTGIYAGFATGVVIYPLVRSLKRTDAPRRIWLLLAVVPIGVDWALGFAGVWTNTHISRFLTGAFLGIVCALYVVPGLMDVLEIDWRRFFKRTEVTPVRDQSTVMPISHDRAAPSDYSSPANRI